MGSCVSSAGNARSTRYREGDAIRPALSIRQPLTDAVILQSVHTDAINDVCGIDGCLLFASCGEQGTVAVHDPYGPAPVQTWQGHSAAVNRVCYVPRADLVASASRDLTVRLWRRGIPDPAGILKGHDLTISAVQATCDGRRLCTGSRDTTVRLWDIETQKQIYRVHKSQNLVTCLKWYPDASSQNVIIQGAEDLRVRIWDTRAGCREVQILQGYVYFPLALDVSPNGEYLLTASKGFNGIGCEARLWDLRGGASQMPSQATASFLTPDEFASRRPVQIRQFVGHVQDTTACAFIPESEIWGDRRLLVTASKDGTIKLWDQESGQILSEHVEVGSGAFTSLSILSSTDSAHEQPSAWVNNQLQIARMGASSNFSAPAYLSKAESVFRKLGGCTFVASSYNSGLYVYTVRKDCTFTCIAKSAFSDENAHISTTAQQPLANGTAST